MAAISHHMSGYSAFAFVGHATIAYMSGFSIWTFFAVPIFIALLVFALQPELASALTGSLLGIAILGLAILTYVLGIYWLRSILSQEI